MDLKLRNAAVLVTGGSRGIGLAIAKGFVAEGARVAICGRDQARLQAAAAEIGGGTVGFQADLFQPDDCRSVVERAIAHFGGLDVLINNASTNVDGTPGSLEAMTDPQVMERFMGKTMGAIRCTRAALPALKRAGSGRVVNIGGSSARIVGRHRPGAPSGLPQGIGNAALANFTRHLAEEVARDGIVANIIHPSLTRTDRHIGRMERRAASSNISIEAAEAEVGDTFPIGRVPAPEDIVPLVLLFASPLAAAITGQALAVDGGIGMSVQY
jgi:NAD(P)-dependent dehydrogenase (short-subunit alcohol dehydrogenase family)